MSSTFKGGGGHNRKDGLFNLAQVLQSVAAEGQEHYFNFIVWINHILTNLHLKLK